MHLFIPPAKEMVISVPSTAQIHRLPKESQMILNILQSYTISDLKKLYTCSDKIAIQEYERLQSFDTPDHIAQPSFLLYNGLMYRQFNKEIFSTEQKQFMHNHISITSALYGITPIDFPILAHRLDFNTHLNISNHSLTHYWQQKYDTFATTIKQPILSLLSSEFEHVFSKDVRSQFIRITFSENGKHHSTISKKCRGELIRQIILQQIQSINSVKSLNILGFSYSHADQNNTLHFKK